MYTEGGEIQGDFQVLEYEPTDEEKEKMKKNYELFIKDGRVDLKKNEKIIAEEKQRAIEKLKTEIINNLNPQMKDVVELIKLLV